METKSFSYLPAKVKRLGVSFALVASLIALSACGSLRTREQIREEEARARSGQTPSRPGLAPSGDSDTVAVSPTPPPAPTPIPAPAPESFLTKEPPRVGVILGPGSMKAFAHIGVLKEMSRARLPIRHIVGLEWGAVIGGLYAIQGQANEAEWKAFKLREDDVPGSGLLRKSIQREKAASLNNFFSTIFASHTIERSKVDFACPSYNIRTEKFGWWNRGPMKDGVAKCAAFPPYYSDTDGWLAAPLAIEEAAGYLRAKGANLIVYVDVLAGGELFSSGLIGEHYADYVLWTEARRQAARKQLPGVNVVIRVNTGNHGLTDFDGRRQLMEAGARSAQEVINKLVDQYGF